VGVDAGATLTKLAIRDRVGAVHFELLDVGEDRDAVARRIDALAPQSLGLTGGGGIEIAERVTCRSAAINEFAAWGAGASGLLKRS